jgi:NitT/TauT family transport system ATP-binding protein
MALFKFTQKKPLGKRQPEPHTGRLCAKNVELSYAVNKVKHIAASDIDLMIEPGEFVCLLGPSGCGKSTLLNALAGFIHPSAGSLTKDNVEIKQPGRDRGMVFQSHSLFPWKTVLGNVMHGPLMSGESRREAESIARTFISMVGLDEYAKVYPKVLSGGMKQRVGIARALANYPSVLLMDEPFGALDAQTRAIMQEGLLKLWDELKITVVFVTHDIDEAVFLADRVVVMSSRPGRIVADVPISLPRPRDADTLLSLDFLELKRKCSVLIREQTLATFGKVQGQAEAGSGSAKDRNSAKG